MLILPIGDNLRLRHVPAVTLVLIAINVVVSVIALSISQAEATRMILAYGLIPIRLFENVRAPAGAIDPWASVLTSMFLHAGVLHLAANMLFLWIFGANVEEAIGKLRFLALYLCAGAAAALTHASLAATSRVPMIGASGAVSGILGAYLLLFPGALVRVLFWVLFFVRIALVPAVWWILGWLALQIGSAALADPAMPGVAWYAHLGGFMAGLVILALTFPDWRSVRRDIERGAR